MTKKGRRNAAFSFCSFPCVIGGNQLKELSVLEKMKRIYAGSSLKNTVS